MPQSASECSLEQLKLLTMYWMREKPGYDTKLRVVAILLDIKMRLLLRVDLENRYRLCELSAWVFDLPCFTEKKLCEFKIAGKVFKGPEECLFNSSFIEFVHADENMFNFASTGNVAYRDQLIATLYRPPKSKKQLLAEHNSGKYNGDLRRPYNYFMTEVYTKPIEKLPESYKQIICMFYYGCKKYIVEQFQEVFGSGENSFDTENPYAIAQKILAKEGSLGDLEKVQNENLYNALSLLSDLIKQSKKHE